MLRVRLGFVGVLCVFKLEAHEGVDEVRPDADRVELDAAGRVAARVTRTAAREVEPVHLALDARLSARARFGIAVHLLSKFIQVTLHHTF